ncbi:MAG: hypothetical protein KAT94_02300 [Candidatus Aenigmarchaeota archaeon]|nr:hypothetical protein [Candidatus Aenigmarchaeota archaeon]MCK4531674.1 hypothetical protein [Candidatus Aenigmarchaeota archaeon]
MVTTEYKVQQLIGSNPHNRMHWGNLYSGFSALEAKDIAGKKVTEYETKRIKQGIPRKAIRVLEIFTENGRFLGEIEYHVNPPAHSGNKIPKRRGPEICVREVRGVEINDSELLKYPTL